MQLRYDLLSILLFKIIVCVNSHIGHKCAIGAICWPINPRVYCDKNSICRCRPEYPVQVGIHDCDRAKRFGDYCQKNDQCTFFDNNTHCYQERCDCLDDYVFLDLKCVEKSAAEKANNRNILGFLPTLALLIVIFISVPCILALLYHYLCYKNPDDSEETRLNSNLNGRNISTEIEMDISPCPEATLSSLPSYETVVTYDPPPSYEDATKNGHSPNRIIIPRS